MWLEAPSSNGQAVEQHSRMPNTAVGLHRAPKDACDVFVIFFFENPFVTHRIPFRFTKASTQQPTIYIISALLCSNVLYTMTSTLFRNTLLVVTIAIMASRSLAFAPNSQISRNSVASSTTPLMGVFDGEQERKSLTRDSEPEEFFAT